MNRSKCPHCGEKLGNFLYADACPLCHEALARNHARPSTPPKAARPSPWPVRAFFAMMRVVES